MQLYKLCFIDVVEPGEGGGGHGYILLKKMFCLEFHLRTVYLPILYSLIYQQTIEYHYLLLLSVILVQGLCTRTNLINTSLLIINTVRLLNTYWQNKRMLGNNSNGYSRYINKQNKFFSYCNTFKYFGTLLMLSLKDDFDIQWQITKAMWVLATTKCVLCNNIYQQNFELDYTILQ